jgi:hypothetical protein
MWLAKVVMGKVLVATWLGKEVVIDVCNHVARRIGDGESLVTMCP